MGNSAKILKRNDPKCAAILDGAQLTDSRLFELYQKQESVALLNAAFEKAAQVGYPFGSATGCEFRVYLDKIKNLSGMYFIEEFLIVKYQGGAWAARRANINSNSVNFQEIGRLLNGGYYDEVDAVEKLDREACRLILGHNGKVEVALPPEHHNDHE